MLDTKYFEKSASSKLRHDGSIFLETFTGRYRWWKGKGPEFCMYTLRSTIEYLASDNIVELKLV